MVKSDAHQQVGYILRSYPRLSQTFILNEILALERLGLSLHLYALENPQEDLIQTQVAEVRARVQYLDDARRQGWVKSLLQNLQVMFSSPLLYFRTMLFVLRGSDLDAGYRTASRLECFWMAVHLVWLMRRERQRDGRDIRAGEVAHLHAHFAHDPALVGLLASRLAGISFSFTAHARDLYQLAVPALQARARGASAVVTCCAANQEYLTRVLPEPLDAKIRLIYHGVDVEVFTPPRSEGSMPHAPVILSVGRLVAKKGFPDLLEAFWRLKQAGFVFSGMIYGDGPLDADLAARIDQFGLGGYVTLAGARRQQELVPLFQKSTLFALTPTIPPDGDRDGIPNVLVEAMSCGLPVVSTAVAGIPELVVHDHNGLLFPPHDVKGIAAGLAELLSDEGRRRRLGAAARQSVLDRFDLNAGACRMAGLFEQIRTV